MAAVEEPSPRSRNAEGGGAKLFGGDIDVPFVYGVEEEAEALTLSLSSLSMSVV